MCVVILCLSFGVYFPCSGDLVQNWQPYPVDIPNLLNESDETIHTHPLPPFELYLHRSALAISPIGGNKKGKLQIEYVFDFKI